MGFTPVQTFLGGILLHLSTSGLLTETGRIFGISSILDGAIFGDHARWRWAILAGLVGGPALTSGTGLGPALPDAGTWVWASLPMKRLALAGALVGFGAKLGSGCTSGHFLCGVSRLSPRSLIATCTFFITAVLTAKIFPAPISDTLPAYTATYPSKDSLTWLGGAVAVAVIARLAIKTLTPKIFAACRDKETPENVGPVSATEETVALLPYLAAGLTFAVGLSMSGMINPLKVTGFLRMPPPLDTFDPSLAMVVAGGVIPNAIHWFNLQRKQKLAPSFNWEKWQVPTRKDIDWRLIVGSFAFGAGWGLCGVCPGPAICAGGQMAYSALNGVDVTDAATGWAAYFANLLLGMVAVRGLDSILA